MVLIIYKNQDVKKIVLGLVVFCLFACKTSNKTASASENKDKNEMEEKNEAVVPEPNTRGVNTKVVAPSQSLSAPFNNTSNPNTGARPK